MKKFSAVLLILALVGGALFAGFTGSAGVSFGVDLDKETYGFKNTTSLTADLKFFELLVDNAGDGDIYAEIEAELSLGLGFEGVGSGYNPFAGFSQPSAALVVLQGLLAEFEEDNAIIDEDGEEVFDYDELTPALQLAYDELLAAIADATPAHGLNGVAKITSAKIVGDNWYVGILGALGAPNFAKTAIELNDDTGASLLDLRTTLKAPGIEVGFADYVFGLGVTGDYGAKDYTFLVSARTPVYELADGVTANAGAAVLLENESFKGAASVAAGFANDDLDVSLASDLLFSKVGTADFAFDAEVAVAAAYDFLTADIYYATRAMAALYEDSPYGGAENILSVLLGAEIEGFDITVGGLDLVNQQDLFASVGYAINDQISVAVRGGYNILGEKWTAGAGVKYTHDMFVAKLDADVEGVAELDIFKLGASISSETLVDGATLALGYANKNFIAKQKGAITASATIEF